MLKRVERWGWLYSLESESAFTWAEPGDPPLTQLAPKGQHLIAPYLRAPQCPERLEKPPRVWPTRLKPWQERELLRRWRENPDHTALSAHCEAHRPMVARMAQKYVGANRKIIIEYGMFGLRFAASPQWPNRKKKGAMAGYDPAKARFGLRPLPRREVHEGRLEGHEWHSHHQGQAMRSRG